MKKKILTRGKYRTRVHREMVTAWIRTEDAALLRTLKGEESLGWVLEKIVQHFRFCNQNLQSGSTLLDK